MIKDIPFEFLPFFDSELVRGFGVIPLAFENGVLFVGGINSPNNKVKRAIEELIPFKIHLRKVEKEFFEKMVNRIYFGKKDFVIFDKKRLIFPMALDLLSEKSKSEDILRYWLFRMIKNKKKFILLSEQYLNSLSLPFYFLIKVKEFFENMIDYNPLIIKVDRRKLFLYYKIEENGNIYLELLPSKFGEGSVNILKNQFKTNNLILIGKNSLALELILYCLLLNNIKKNGVYLLTRKELRFADIENHHFIKETFIKVFDLLLKKGYENFVISGNIDLYPFMLLGSKTKFIINLPLKNSEELKEKIKKEKIEHALKARSDIKILDISVNDEGEGKISREKIRFSEIF